MTVGPLGRIVAQFIIVAGSAFGRAIIQAYKDAAKQGIAAGSTCSRSQPLTLRPRMSRDEARKILGFPSGPDAKTPSKEEILSRYDRLFQINAPSGSFAGSPYLQKRVAVARTIMLEECAQSAKTGGKLSNARSEDPKE